MNCRYTTENQIVWIKHLYDYSNEDVEWVMLSYTRSNY